MKSQIVSDSTPESFFKKLERRVRKVTVPISDRLYAYIERIQCETGKDFKSILMELIDRLVSGQLHWIFIRPVCGAGAGVTLQTVNDKLSKTFFLLRDAKGVIARGGSEDQRLKIEKALLEALELWTHSQKLASETFYSLEELRRGREAYNYVNAWADAKKKKLAEENAKGEKGDRKLVEHLGTQIANLDVVTAVLTRLGFSPEGPVGVE